MGFWEGFQQGWGVGQEILDARDKKEIQDLYKSGRASAEAEAAQSGKTIDVLPESQIGRGYGVDTTDNSYTMRDKGTADMVANQERDYAGLQQGIANEQDILRNGIDQGNGVRTYPLRDIKDGVDTNRMQAPAQQVNAAPVESQRGYTGPGGAFEMQKEQLPGYGMKTQLPTQSASEIFNQKYAPKVIDKLEAQGRLKEAQTMRGWLRDEKNQRYGEEWTVAYQSFLMGDVNGAIQKIQDLYNLRVPDGRHVVLVPGKDGNYTGQIRDTESGRVIREFTGSAKDIAMMGLGVLSPEQQVTALAKAQEKEDKTVVVPAGGAALKGGQVIHQQPLKGSRTGGGTVKWEKAKDEKGKMRYWRQDPETGEDVWGAEVADKTMTKTSRSGAGGKGKGKGALTVPQQRENASILAARQRVADVMRRGGNVREIALEDKGLAADMVTARQRLYGDDPEADKWTGGKTRDVSGLARWAQTVKDPATARSMALKQGWTEEEINQALAGAK